MLTTLTNCKTYLNINNDEDDIFIKQLITMAQATIENICKRKFELNEYEEEIQIANNKVFTNQYPIQEIASLKINDNETNAYKKHKTYIALNNGTITLTGGLMYDKTEKIATVTYTAGYESFEIPQDLVFACTKLVAFYYKEAREDRLGVSQEKLDVMSTNYIVDIPVTIMNLLKPYRKVNI